MRLTSKNGKHKRSRQVALGALCMLAIIVVLLLKACSTTSTSSDSSSIQSSSFVRKEEHRVGSPFFASTPPTPAIVWLQAMPHSASGFVMSLVSRATNLAMATNYGDDVTKKGQYSISINPRISSGPYWAGLGTQSGSERKLPFNNVLVQTYCSKTKTTPHVPTLEQYMQDCVATFGRTAPDISVLTQYSYPFEDVTKSIYLIRNPLTQIISRFQKDVKQHQEDSDKQWLKQFPNDGKGLNKWCNEEDDKKHERQTQYYSAGTVAIMANTTCHSYIAEYIAWHNLAVDTLNELKIPSLIVHYDELLDASVEETLDRMLGFLELNKETMPSQRLGDKESVDTEKYLSKSQQRQIRRLIQKLASEETWKHVQRYFEHVM